MENVYDVRKKYAEKRRKGKFNSTLRVKWKSSSRIVA